MKISETGKFVLTDRLNAKFANRSSTGFDDAVVIESQNRATLVSSVVLLEGIHFNLVYTPLKHLGYKAVIRAASDIAAMNATPKQILVNVGISSRFDVEATETLYDGIRAACDACNLELADNRLSSSLTGMILSITATGEAPHDAVCYRSGAKATDLVCISGDIGASYMGLQILERERKIYESNRDMQPALEGYEYILQRQLHPQARIDMLATFETVGAKPTAMTTVIDCLATDVLQICKHSQTGVRIYLDKIPIASETFAVCNEMNIDAVTAALNGGDDFELLFTVPLSDYDKIRNHPDFAVIGHITDIATGAYLVTPDGNEIAIQ